MIILGLTGSIGMGKSTTAQMFSDFGIPVHDADATVHRLYSGEAAPLIEHAFPGTTNNSGVDRTLLAAKVVGDKKAMTKLEEIVHPMVRREENAFLDDARKKAVDLVVLDIPLLFETEGDKRVDGIVVVTAPASVQRERVLARAGMSEDKFAKILARQYPDDKKREQADFIIDTSLEFENTRKEVGRIIEQVRSGNWVPPEKSDRIERG